jgi:hypothetical protein
MSFLMLAIPPFVLPQIETRLMGNILQKRPQLRCGRAQSGQQRTVPVPLRHAQPAAAHGLRFRAYLHGGAALGRRFQAGMSACVPPERRFAQHRSSPSPQELEVKSQSLEPELAKRFPGACLPARPPAAICAFCVGQLLTAPAGETLLFNKGL